MNKMPQQNASVVVSFFLSTNCQPAVQCFKGGGPVVDLSQLMRTASYTTLTNFCTKYLMMCKVYTDVGGIKKLYPVCPHVRKIIHSLKLVDYLHVQADNPSYNYYLSHGRPSKIQTSLNICAYTQSGRG